MTNRPLMISGASSNFSDPVIKKLLNSLKCPICRSGMDIKTYGPETTGHYNYSCVSDNFHYSIHLASNNGLDYPHTAPIHPIITTELVMLFEENHKYDIVQSSASILGTINETEISV